MSRSPWKSVRLFLLAAIFGSTVWVLGRAIAAPKATATTQQTYPLPETIPLNSWAESASSQLAPAADLPAGRQYQYRQQKQPLEVQVRMLVGDGNVSRFLFVYTPIRSANANLQIKHQAGVGYYGVLTHDNKAYLSACINSRGESTVTESQFMQNRYTHDLQFTRVLPWILGQEPLLDQRCLWTLMYVPLSADAKTNPTAIAEAFKTLETAWFAWYEWWEKRF